MEIGIANPKKQDTATLRLITSYNIQHSGKGIMKHWILVWKGSYRFDIKSNQYTFEKKKCIYIWLKERSLVPINGI